MAPKKKKPLTAAEDKALKLETTVTNAISTIEEHTGPVAIGLDMAAQEEDWGLCVLLLDAELKSGTLELLLPSPSLGHANYPILHNILEATRKGENGTKRPPNGAMAVDVPFGWPVAHGPFATNWSAWTGQVASQEFWAKTENETREDFEKRRRDEFERRLTDRTLYSTFRTNFGGHQPLPVGADKIASAAFKWAQCRIKLNNLLGSVVLGFPEEKAEEFKPPFVTFETYPGAFVNINLPEIRSYKGGTEKQQPRSTIDRKRIWDQLQKEYKLSTVDTKVGKGEEWITSSQEVIQSHAFDALLCAFAAWDYLRWRGNGPENVTLTTPDILLDTAWCNDRDQIQREGWILVRNGPALLETETQLRKYFSNIVPKTLKERTVKIKCATKDCVKKPQPRIAASDLHQTQRCEECQKQYTTQKRRSGKK